MRIIQENPYRILGVYANAPIRNRVANISRLKAFLRVGRQASFDLDLSALLGSIERTTESVSMAESALALPNDQLRYAQFWFVNATPTDAIAFNNLFAGQEDRGLSIWQRRHDIASLQNRLILALIHQDYQTALSLAEALYAPSDKAFSHLILDESAQQSNDELAHQFLDTLCDEIGAQTVAENISNGEWKQYVRQKNITPLISQLEEALAASKATRGQGADARLQAGKTLMAATRTLLAQLQVLLPATDVQYQMLADKLANEILQCGIDYYNNSDEPDAAHKAMTVQSYALSVAVGSMAKDRCQENVNILRKIIADLPPQEVWAEDRAIKQELREYNRKPDKIEHALTLINQTKSHLQSMKTKLGAQNSYYLKISTLVVSAALHNLIEEVNEAQKHIIFDANAYLLTSVIREAWEAAQLLDDFDMEADFRRRRYQPNRGTLSSMYFTLVLGIPKRPSPPVQEKSGCFGVLLITFTVLSFIALISCINHGCNGTSAADSITWDSVEVSEIDTTCCEHMPTQSVISEPSRTYTRLQTGSRPYEKFYGAPKTGINYLLFRTSGNCDYVIIVRDSENDKVMNHIYIRGGDTEKLYLPNGVFNVYFYSGEDWDEEKSMGDVVGGFVRNETLQKDPNLSLYGATCEYTLYPVTDGNFSPRSANAQEVF